MVLDTVHQFMRDKLAGEVQLRWCMFLFVLVIYLIRVLIKQSHHIITYAVGIYLIQGFILFATPKMKNAEDPFETLTEEQIQEEQKRFDGPFIRNLPEYDFWVFYMKVVSISFILTFFSFLDIPVFVPLLVLYFFIMVFATLAKLMQHQKLYKYNPWTTISSFKKNLN
ncbi:RER1C [Ecytonucleospora hepatopenaei]|uniref:Protein RER1 n=1 Tax=Ecytonucleospora hepatopenaei TaxID=646526 RepID=A0A1W0E9E5_9MICR|nr:RER1C [Ecytonucleospora hepatopenaei]